MARVKRVDSVKVHERGSERFHELSGGEDQARFYDLTVGGHPSFYANGLLVHNCVDDELESQFNTNEYTKLRITNEMVLEHDDDIRHLLDLPGSHENFGTTWIGMDVGYTNDPSEILVFAEVYDKKVNKKGESALKLITRVQLERINNPNQVAAIMWLMSFYKPRTFAMDKTGVGLPLFQDLQEAAKQDKRVVGMLDRIKGYNFSEKILVDFDSTIEVDEFRGDVVEDTGIRKNVLEYSSDKLRWLVDNQRLWLPWDTELIGEYQGQTYTYDKSTMDMYGRRKVFSKGNFHALDASRMAVLGWAQHSIEATTKEDKFEPTTAIILT